MIFILLFSKCRCCLTVKVIKLFPHCQCVCWGVLQTSNPWISLYIWIAGFDGEVQGEGYIVQWLGDFLLWVLHSNRASISHCLDSCCSSACPSELCSVVVVYVDVVAPCSCCAWNGETFSLNEQAFMPFIVTVNHYFVHVYFIWLPNFLWFSVDHFCMDYIYIYIYILTNAINTV